MVQLDEVEVKTHEEDEDVDFKIRAKLFRFSETLLNKGSGKKEWIERGVGEVKLLKHRENSMVRVLMRQEKTMKIICNHVVDPRIELEPNVGSDRSWVWSAWDFSSGELEDTIFAIRFGNSDGAKEYKAAFEKAKAATPLVLVSILLFFVSFAFLIDGTRVGLQRLTALLEYAVRISHSISCIHTQSVTRFGHNIGRGNFAR